MKKEQFNRIKTIADLAAREGDTSSLASPSGVQLVADLVGAYEAMTRAEGFWGVRAPLINDELLVARQLEVFARTIANGGELSDERLAELRGVLEALDTVRAANDRALAKEAETA